MKVDVQTQRRNEDKAVNERHGRGHIGDGTESPDRSEDFGHEDGEEGEIDADERSTENQYAVCLPKSSRTGDRERRKGRRERRRRRRRTRKSLPRALPSNESGRGRRRRKQE